MYNLSTGWHTTIQPFYYFSGRVLSILAIFMLVWYLLIKLRKVEKEKYQRPINIVNLIFCIINSVLIAFYVFELVVAWSAGYINDQFAFINRSMGLFWILYLGLTWLPLLLTLLFWRKKNRVNINLSLFIVFMFNLSLWVDRIYITITSLVRQ